MILQHRQQELSVTAETMTLDLVEIRALIWKLCGYFDSFFGVAPSYTYILGLIFSKHCQGDSQGLLFLYFFNNLFRPIEGILFL